MDKIKKTLKNLILLYYKILVRMFPVNKKVIIFQSSLGRDYSGNPKAIYEEMVEQGIDKIYRCYFILDNPSSVQLPGKVKKIKNSRLHYYYIMATAGIWISDTRFQNYMIKRKETIYIQTWHGTPLKKLGLDMDKIGMAEECSLSIYKKEFKKNTSTWDYLIAQNEFSVNVFYKAFAFQGNLLKTGYPRNDILFKKNNPEYINVLKQKYHISINKKVMLYAPTWRDDAYYNKADYKFVTSLDFIMMKKAFQKEYVLLIKYHYMVNDKTDWTEYEGFIQLAPKGCDISELYLLSDLLITDYSSAMFDYSILKRPMFFYVYDYDNYKEELRGFYFDLLKEAPGPVVNETVDLVKAIIDYNNEEYKELYSAFNERYHTYEKGNAAEQVINIVQQN